MNKTINHQQGIASVVILVLLVAGILAGTILTQQGVNFLPHAAGTIACDGQTLNSQSIETQGAFRVAYPGDAEAEWVRQHEAELASKGTPCGSGKTEGFDCKLLNTDSISNSCANEIDSKNPGFMGTIEGSNKNTCTRAQILSNWCASNQADCNAKKQAATACGGSGGTGAESQAACPVPADPKQTVDETYLQAKVTNNLVRYCGILNGITELCTPADLGVPPQKNDGSGNRLLLCSRANSSIENLNLIWLSVVNNKLEAASGLSEPKKDNVAGMINLNQALTAVGLDPKSFTCDK